MFDGARFEGDGAGLYAACLLGNDEPQDRQAIQTRVGDVVREKWQADSGESLGQYAGLHTTRDVLRLGRVFAWSVEERPPLDPMIRLTDIGREAAWLGLQTQGLGASEPALTLAGRSVVLDNDCHLIHPVVPGSVQ